MVLLCIQMVWLRARCFGQELAPQMSSPSAVTWHGSCVSSHMLVPSHAFVPGACSKSKGM